MFDKMPVPTTPAKPRDLCKLTPPDNKIGTPRDLNQKRQMHTMQGILSTRKILVLGPRIRYCAKSKVMPLWQIRLKVSLSKWNDNNKSLTCLGHRAGLKPLLHIGN